MWNVVSVFFKGKEGEYSLVYRGRDGERNRLMEKWILSLSNTLTEDDIFLWSNRVEPKNVEKLISEFIETEKKMKEVCSSPKIIFNFVIFNFFFTVFRI
jgi:hypothetical protein